MASIALKTFIGLRQSSPENNSIKISKSLPTNQTHRRLRINASKSSPRVTGRNLRVAVIGGGPAGGAAAETLAKGGIETFLIERKMDNCKPCGGAIPLCMVGEFDLPLDIIDRKVTKMKMISPSNVAVDIGQTLKPHEYIGMVRREVLDAYLRDRAAEAGASVLNGLFLRMDMPKAPNSPYVLHYTSYDSKTNGAGEKCTLEVDAVIGADGANSRVAKSINAGDYEYAIAFQERIRISDDKMKYYENLAEMYVGDDVSPDFYGWVFPKCDHVAVGTGTVTHKADIKKFQLATRLRADSKITGGKIIRVEAHPIPEHPRPRRLQDRVALVGDAAGYVTKCSGEGIYFAAKSGRMCAEAIVEGSENGKRMGEVFVKQPPGFENNDYPDHVYKLDKALYGLKQAPRAWYDRLSKFLLSHGYSRGKIDNTLFFKNKEKGLLIVQIYVDDIIFGATNKSLTKEFANLMSNEFEMSMMGELNYFLGLQIKQTPGGTWIHQQKYVKELLKRFKMDDAKPTDTPISPATKLDLEGTGSAVEQKLYRGMIGSLLYLTASRPDIVFSVGLCARFQTNPKESHIQAVKRILRYLKGTSDLGFWYPKGSNFDLVGYADADYAGYLGDRKSTTGMAHFLGSCLISWGSKKQNSVALSTAEAEYVAAASCCAQLLWIKQQLSDFGLKIEQVPIFCDNTSAINIAKNPVQHKRTKHIDIRHHFLRDNVEKGLISMNFCTTEEQIADIFTKALAREHFERNRLELGMMKTN